ncbi:MAG: HIT domain-containing protein [Acidobacteriota bacterium]
MRSLLTPWRYDYLVQGRPEGECIFCVALAGADDAQTLVVYRAAHNFIILNRYPYTNGHVMIVPNDHLAFPSESGPEQRSEMMHLAAVCEETLRDVYSADGINLGMNLGVAAGAGIEAHYHLHVVPRWQGDTNFMAVTADTRLVPEDFARTRARLRETLCGRLGPEPIAHD